MLPRDRLVCAFVDPVKVGQQFKQWLLHVTIVPWFRLNDTSEQVGRGLQPALQSIAPFQVRIVGDDRLGPHRNRPAHILEADVFPEVERRVRSYLHKKRAWLVDETTKVRRPFRPHVTYQAERHLAPEAIIHCEQVYIVEQKGDYKEIVAEIRLGETTA